MKEREIEKWRDAWVYVLYGRRPKNGSDKTMAHMRIVHYQNESRKLGVELALKEYDPGPFPGNGIQVG